MRKHFSRRLLTERVVFGVVVVVVFFFSFHFVAMHIIDRRRVITYAMCDYVKLVMFFVCFLIQIFLYFILHVSLHVEHETNSQ